MKGYKLIVAVRDHSKARWTGKLVMFALANRLDENGISSASYATLMADTGLSLSGIKKAIKAIPTNELVILEKGAGGRTSRYLILLGIRWDGP